MTLRDGPWWDQPPRSIESLIRHWPAPASNGFGWGPAAAAAENRRGWILSSRWLWDQDYQAWLRRHFQEWRLPGVENIPPSGWLPYLAEKKGPPS